MLIDVRLRLGGRPGECEVVSVNDPFELVAF